MLAVVARVVKVVSLLAWGLGSAGCSPHEEALAVSLAELYGPDEQARSEELAQFFAGVPSFCDLVVTEPTPPGSPAIDEPSVIVKLNDTSESARGLELALRHPDAARVMATSAGALPCRHPLRRLLEWQQRLGERNPGLTALRVLRRANLLYAAGPARLDLAGVPREAVLFGFH